MNAYNKQYLDLVEDILNNGIEAPCRTGNKVLVTLNKSLTWDLKNGFPLLTFRQIPFKGVKGEVSCFLEGVTDKRIYRATTFSEEKEDDKEMIKNNMKVFNSYFLGGLEVLHEQFVDQCITDDDYLKKMFDYVRHFDEEQDGEALKASIDKLLNK